MQLLVDEDTKSKKLIRLLSEAGHDVVTTADLGLDRMDDPAVLQKGRETGAEMPLPRPNPIL